MIFGRMYGQLWTTIQGWVFTEGNNIYIFCYNPRVTKKNILRSLHTFIRVGKKSMLLGHNNQLGCIFRMHSLSNHDPYKQLFRIIKNNL